MKTTEKTKETSKINVEIINTTKRVVWNSRRHYSYLTQYKFNN